MNETEGAILFLAIFLFVSDIFIYIVLNKVDKHDDKIDNLREQMAATNRRAYKSNNDEHIYELQSKIQVLEKDWFNEHPCEYRKTDSVCIGSEDFSLIYESKLVCTYPRPEGGYTHENDMLSYCSRCKLRKEPEKVD